HDMNSAFTTRDKELLKNQFFRSHRLVSKLLDNIHNKIQEREYFTLSDYFDCLIYMKSKLGSWYERIAQLFEQENMNELAERKWFAGIAVHPGDIDRFIQYAHATLQLHNLYVSKNIKENLKQVSPANARDVIT